jgi:hypothetical protein
MQVLSHDGLPLLDLLGQVMHFCKEDCTTFMDAKGRPVDMFSFAVTY